MILRLIFNLDFPRKALFNSFRQKLKDIFSQKILKLVPAKDSPVTAVQEPVLWTRIATSG